MASHSSAAHLRIRCWGVCFRQGASSHAVVSQQVDLSLFCCSQLIFVIFVVVS